MGHQGVFSLVKGHLYEESLNFYWNISRGTKAMTRCNGSRCLYEAAGLTYEVTKKKFKHIGPGCTCTVALCMCIYLKKLLQGWKTREIRFFIFLLSAEFERDFRSLVIVGSDMYRIVHKCGSCSQRCVRLQEFVPVHVNIFVHVQFLIFVLICHKSSYSIHTCAYVIVSVIYYNHSYP